jgi:hypothetical protein
MQSIRSIALATLISCVSLAGPLTAHAQDTLYPARGQQIPLGRTVAGAVHHIRP